MINNFNNKRVVSSIIVFILFIINISHLQAQSFDYTGFNTGYFSQELNSPYFNNQFNKYQPTFLEPYSFQSESNITTKSKQSNYDNKSIKRRRNMLEWHQILGIATWFSWLATNLSGERAEKSFYKEYEPYAIAVLVLNPTGNSTQSYFLYQTMMNASPWDSTDSLKRQHTQLAYTTFSLYALTAGLAFLSPSSVSLEREEGWSTIFTHKAMIFIHLPAMLALPILGAETHRNGPEAVHKMQAVGWTGFSALSIALVAFYF